jgi:NDP-sugar pyrophosphorylase family protein
MKIIVPIGGRKNTNNEENFFEKFLFLKDQSIIMKFAHFISSLKYDEIIFILKKSDIELYNFHEFFKKYFKHFKIQVIQNQTKGSICSILLAIDHFQVQEEVIVLSIDYSLSEPIEKFVSFCQVNSLDAGVVSFQSNSTLYSYVKIFQNQIIEFTEKERISNIALLGIYYYRDSNMMFQSFKRALFDSITKNNQFYLTPTLNYFLINDLKVNHYFVSNELIASFKKE